MGPGDRGAEDELVDEDVVADLKRGNHRAARDLEGFDDKRAQREGHPDGDQDRLEILAELALPPGAEAHVDLTIGLLECVVERLLFEGAFIDGGSEVVEIGLELLTLLGRQIADNCLLVPEQDAVSLVDEGPGPLEVASQRLWYAGTEGRQSVPSERELMPCGPQRHLKEGERHDRDRHGLFAHRRLDPAKEACLVHAAGWGKRPHENECEAQWSDEEPERPVQGPNDGVLFGQGALILPCPPIVGSLTFRKHRNWRAIALQMDRKFRRSGVWSYGASPIC